jgi:hypothetical protein
LVPIAGVDVFVRKTANIVQVCYQILQLLVEHRAVFAVLSYWYIQQSGMGEKRGDCNRCQVQTDRLVDWISKARVKKSALKRSRRENLRVEAILTSALVKAETLLRVKQLQRFHRWQRVKSELCKTGFDVCNDFPKDKVSNQWDECEDLKSLDRFMRMLNEVKSPVQR